MISNQPHALIKTENSWIDATHMPSIQSFKKLIKQVLPSTILLQMAKKKMIRKQKKKQKLKLKRRGKRLILFRLLHNHRKSLQLVHQLIYRSQLVPSLTSHKKENTDQVKALGTV